MKSVNRVTIHGSVDPVLSLEKSIKVKFATNRSWTDEKRTREEIADCAQVTIHYEN